LRSSARRRGLNLVEILVAVALAAVGFLVIFELFPLGFKAGEKAQSRSIAAGIASDLMSRFRMRLKQYPVAYDYAGNGATDGGDWLSFLPSDQGSGDFGGKIIWYPCRSGAASVPAGRNVGDPDGEPLGDAINGKYYFWGCQMYEVVDPLQKIVPAVSWTYVGSTSAGPITFGNASVASTSTTDKNPIYKNDLIGMRRVTIYLRGPLYNFNDIPKADASNQGGKGASTSAVEVRMASYVTSYRMGDTTLSAKVYGPDADIWGNTRTPSTNKLVVMDVNDFYAWAGAGKMTTSEASDTGPVAAVGNTTVNQNVYGLDNIWIGNSDNEIVSTATASGESNKIVGIHFETLTTIGSSGTLSTPYYVLTLLKPIRGVRTAGTDATDYYDTAKASCTRSGHGGAQHGSHYGYAAGTRVRSLIRLMY